MIASVEDFQAFLAREGITGYDGWSNDEITTALQTAEEWITKQTDREFVPVEETRYFRGQGTPVLMVHELLEITSIQAAGTAVEADEYHLEPLNRLPKTDLRLTVGVWPACVNNEGNIEIAARWGYCENPPQRVVRAACLMATVVGQTGGYVPDPTQAQLTTIRAFNLSYSTEAGTSRAVTVADIMVQAQGLIRDYVDVTARKTRLS